MRTKSLIILLSALLTISIWSAVPCSAADQKPQQEQKAKQPKRQVVLLSCDLHCQGCCDKIMKNIAFEKGVKDIVCNLSARTVTVTFDPRKTDLDTLLRAFDRIGKPAKLVSTQPASPSR